MVLNLILVRRTRNSEYDALQLHLSFHSVKYFPYTFIEKSKEQISYPIVLLFFYDRYSTGGNNTMLHFFLLQQFFNFMFNFSVEYLKWFTEHPYSSDHGLRILAYSSMYSGNNFCQFCTNLITTITEGP